MSDSTVNCGKCAHLWNTKPNGFGICACHARQIQTSMIRPTVALDATCEHAQLSAKFNPDFMPSLRAARDAEAVPPPAKVESLLQQTTLIIPTTQQ
jgi:hypothetical protein